MPSPAALPKLTRFSPTLAEGDQNALRPQIVLDWSVDVDPAQFQDPVTLAGLVTLADDADGSLYSLTFLGSSTPLKRVLLEPTADLPRGGTYRVMVKSLVLGSFGRRSDQEYTWTFKTAGNSVERVALSEPPNATVQGAFPSLSWVALAGSGIVYELQIDTRSDFGSPLYTQTTSASSLTPAGSFAAGTTYFWRVRASQGGTHGAWSEESSFYYGTPFQAHETTRQTLSDASEFGIKRTGFRSGLTNQRAHPPEITVTFTSEPTASFASYVTVTKRSVLPRNDDPNSYLETEVPGAWSQAGKTLTFAPSGEIEANTRYELRIRPELTNLAGLELDEDVRMYWTGRYTPFYCSPMAIRARFRSAEQIPDDLMNYHIFRASLMAKARYQTYVTNAFDWGYDALSEKTVRDSADLTSHGVLLWVEAETTYEMLKSILFEEIRNVDRTRVLQRFQDSLGPGFIEAIREAMKIAKEDRDAADGLLTPADHVTFASRHSQFFPEMWALDAMMGVDLGLRGSAHGWEF